jgi:hypothetical protein
MIFANNGEDPGCGLDHEGPVAIARASRLVFERFKPL